MTALRICLIGIHKTKRGVLRFIITNKIPLCFVGNLLQCHLNLMTLELCLLRFFSIYRYNFRKNSMLDAYVRSGSYYLKTATCIRLLSQVVPLPRSVERSLTITLLGRIIPPSGFAGLTSELTSFIV